MVGFVRTLICFDSKYGPRTKKGRDLGNNQAGDGARFRGRGLVQITERTNYTDWTRCLQNDGVDVNGTPTNLVAHPEQAADSTIAARMAAEGMQKGTFARRKLGDYVNDTKSDYVGALYADDLLEPADVRDALEFSSALVGRPRLLRARAGELGDGVLLLG